MKKVGFIICCVVVLALFCFNFINREDKQKVTLKEEHAKVQNAAQVQEPIALQDIYNYYYSESYFNNVLSSAEGNFTEENKEIKASDFISNEDIVVKADDGAVIFLKQVRGYYVALCSDKKHIVAVLFLNPGIQYNFSLTKANEYQNVTTYNFSANKEISEVLWFDNDNDEYCGGINCYPISLKTGREGKEFYNYIKDAYIGITESEMDDFAKSLDSYERFNKFNVGKYIYYISVYDGKTGAELKLRYSDLVDRHNKYRYDGTFYRKQRFNRDILGKPMTH